MTADSAVMPMMTAVPAGSPRPRWAAAGTAASLVVHGGLLGVLVWGTLREPPPPQMPSEQPVEMVFVAPPPPPAPPVPQPVTEPPPEPPPPQPVPPEPPVIEPPPPVITSAAAVAPPLAKPPEKKKPPPKKKEPPPPPAPAAPVPVVETPPVQAPVSPAPPAPPQIRGPVSATPDYLGLASAHLQKYRDYPRAAQRRGIQGRGAVLIVLGRDGHVRSVTVRQSTGSDLLDEAMLKTVERANPLPPNPQADGPDLELLLPFDYGLR
ncbi:energy transducer TonB [Novispirillum itersonii]|uniref:energy transducer TonB n=1 Tax=Novispirillum itersonii TaxID=189 RepID=UPI00036171D9|nr:energy transducer TonB [Novispirillum itersonii]